MFEKPKSHLEYVYPGIPFYRDPYDRHGVKPDDIRHLEDFTEKIPIVTKEMLRESQVRHPPFGDFLGIEPAEVFIRASGHRTAHKGRTHDRIPHRSRSSRFTLASKGPSTHDNADARAFEWLSRNIRHVFDGGFGSRGQIPGHGRLGDLNAELQEFTMDPRCAPQRVFAAHTVNQGADIVRGLVGVRPCAAATSTSSTAGSLFDASPSAAVMAVASFSSSWRADAEEQ